MTISRRSFIKSSIFAGTGIIISPAFACKGSPVSFLKEIGICTNISNWKILETGGYTYVEEAVQSSSSLSRMNPYLMRNLLC